MTKPLPSSRIPADRDRDLGSLRPDPLAGKSPPFQITVRFYRVMKPRRVYPLVVELPRASAKPVAGQPPLVVTPVIAGAVVAPAEQTLDLNAAGGKLTFQVTPVAKGRMPDSRIELSQQGRAVDKIPLKMKAKTQRLTWLLFLLTLILPSALLYYTDKNLGRLSGDVPRLDYTDHSRAAEGGPPRQNPAGAPGDAPAPPVLASPTKTRPSPGMPGEILQFKISRIIHDNCPTHEYASWLIKKPEPYVVKEQPLNPFSADTSDFVEWVAYWIGDIYYYLCTGAYDIYPAFCLAACMAALTLLSLVTHSTYRGRVRRLGIRGLEGASAGHARLSASREEPATVVEAAQ